MSQTDTQNDQTNENQPIQPEQPGTQTQTETRPGLLHSDPPAGQENAGEGAPAAKPEGEALPAYQDFRLADGLEVDAQVLSDFKTLAGGMKLSQEQAQGLVDLQSKVARGQMERFSAVRDGWVAEIKADPDFGGEFLGRTVEEAKKGLAVFDPSGKVMQLIEGSGMGDNPDILRFLSRIGRAHKGDVVLPGSQAVPADRDNIPLANRLWPDMKD
jgi:hypothetical protein